MTHVFKLTAAAVACCCLLAAGRAAAQEKATSEERNTKLEEYRNGSKPVDAEGRKLFEKVANYYAAQLVDANVQRDRINAVVTEVERKFHKPGLPEEFYRIEGAKRTFNEEFGKTLATVIEPVLLGNTKVIARLNAARMLADGPCKGGADAVAEALLKCLANPQETDGVRLWALKGLGSLFALVPERTFPERSVFQKQAMLQLPTLEQQSILALIAFVERKNELPDGMPIEDKDAYNYVRREAIKALGQVRVPVVMNQGNVTARPALTLLKAARRDLPAPPVNVGEQVDAIIGFCQLLPDRQRDLQLNYAVPQIAEACADAGQFFITSQAGMEMPWKVTAVRLRDAFEHWNRVNIAFKYEGAVRIGQLAGNVDQNLLIPFEQAAAAVAPNLPAIRAFASGVRQETPAASLFKSDPATTVKPVPWQ